MSQDVAPAGEDQVHGCAGSRAYAASSLLVHSIGGVNEDEVTRAGRRVTTV
jgi:hypothetical protein